MLNSDIYQSNDRIYQGNPIITYHIDSQWIRNLDFSLIISRVRFILILKLIHGAAVHHKVSCHYRWCMSIKAVSLITIKHLHIK